MQYCGFSNISFILGSFMTDDILEIYNSVKVSIDEANSQSDLDEIRVSMLGRKGLITDKLKGMSLITDLEEKKLLGKSINEVKNFIEEQLSSKRSAFSEKDFLESLKKTHVDITLPGRQPSVGAINILTQVEEEIVSIFNSIGFGVAEGFELDDDYHNFEALNIPYYHPARDSHDTFYVSDNRLIRTHTSGMQIRLMKDIKPPIAAISPGKVGRRDAIDAKHSPVFHQVEGFLVDKNVSFNDLKGILELFCQRIFGSRTQIRLRPDFFPFVEPGADLSATCVVCKGVGCKTCGYEGWIELMGAGMIHPNVFEHVGYDPKVYSGLAFGMGVERIAMLKYGITDIRMFYENDISFLKQW